MELLDLLKDYRQFLIENHLTTKESARSYVSYLKNSLLEIIGDDYENIEFSKSKGSTKDYDIFVAYTVEYLNNAINKHSTNHKHAIKTYKNYHSAFISFREFLKSSGIEDVSLSRCKKNSLVIVSHTVTLTKKQLLPKLKGRLATQDRAYSNVMYIPSLINNIIKMNKPNGALYRKIINSALEEMKIFYDSTGKYVKFKEVVEMTIDRMSKNVTIKTVNGSTHTMYTENPHTKMFEKMSAVDFRELSIDHDIPLEKLLNSSRKRYLALHDLSLRVKDLYCCTGTDYRKMIVGKESLKDVASKRKTFNSLQGSLSTTFAYRVFEDMEDLYKQITFSVMYLPYNTAKSNMP